MCPLLNKPSDPFYSGNRVMSKTKITDGNWHFLAMTFDGFSLKLYVDGRLESEAFTYDGQRIYQGSGGDIRIATLESNGLYKDGAFPGWTDDAKIYRMALDQTDIIAAYEASGLDYCPELLEGDVDGDCDVDLTDYAKLASNWLQ